MNETNEKLERPGGVSAEHPAQPAKGDAGGGHPPSAKEKAATAIIREFNEKFRSKDSPPLDARQLIQFMWIIDQVWEASVLLKTQKVLTEHEHFVAQTALKKKPMSQTDRNEIYGHPDTD